MFDISARAISYPFRYSDGEWIDLGTLTQPAYVDPTAYLTDWVGAFVYSTPTDTRSGLKDINAGISSAIAYQAREDQGTQGPLDTLDRGVGSCWDLAVLFVESVRTLGFGARAASQDGTMP